MPWFACLLAAVIPLGACASRTVKPRTNLDPLFYAPGGGGEYPVDPAELDRQTGAYRPRRGAPPQPPTPTPEVKAEPCKHTWEYMGQQTHTYIDREGSPALCTPRYCTQCGMVIHECSKRGR